MEKLKAEMAKKKALADAMRQKVAGEEAAPEETKFLRQRDRESLKERELEEAQRQLDAQREEKRRLQQQRDEEARSAAARLTGNLPKASSSSTASAVTEPASALHPNLRVKYSYILQLPVTDVKQRLRKFKHPATVFGETDSDRKERLLNLCIEQDLQGWADVEGSQPTTAPTSTDAATSRDAGHKRTHHHHDQDDETHGSDAAVDTHSSKKARTNSSNDINSSSNNNSNEGEALTEENALQRVDAPAAEAADGDHHSDHAEDDHSDNDDDDHSDTPHRSKIQIPRPAHGLFFDATIRYHQIDGLRPEKVVYKFFRSLIKQWAADLEARPEHEKVTGRGREDSRAYQKCHEYIRPLFKLCRQKQVPPDILHRLLLMVQHCEEGNFVKANDEYMRTAIGNAAWPMGLTMVGIHERSGREKISTSKVRTTATLRLCCSAAVLL
jgi:pre-mRNA-splicing factor 18